MHDGRSVERLVTAPARTVLAGQLMQFVVNQRQQLVKRLAITIRQLLEKVFDGA